MSLLLTILLFVLIFGLIILMHEGGHFLAARREGMKVREFAFGFPPRLWSKRVDGTQYSLNAIPIGGYVSILGEDSDSDDPNAFGNKSAWARFRVAIAGIVMNVVFAWILLVVYLLIAPLLPRVDAVVVAAVVPGSGAQRAGIQPNDFLVRINGQPLTSDESLSAFTQAHRGEVVSVRLTRRGVEQTVSATLSPTDSAPLGVSIADVGDVPHVPWYQTPWYALVELGTVIVSTILFLGSLVASLIGFGTGTVSVAQVSGPVGIFGLLRQIQLLGPAAVIHFAAMISLAVGIFNLLPIPALDGGRAFLLFFEGLFRRRALSVRTEGWIHAVGFALLLAMILVITYLDVRKLG